MEDKVQLEERLAHLERAVEDLSEVAARQEREIARLAQIVALLRDREAEREAEAGTAPFADRRPPHW